MQRYGQVALTGESIDVERESPRLQRVFNVRAYRVGGAGSRRVAILFNDITERRDARRRLEAQLERLNLLQQITRATGERHDLASIYQVVIRTLEDAPFYARSVVSAQLCGEPVMMMHESLSLDRFRQPVVQAMLPFRMPRARR